MEQLMNWVRQIAFFLIFMSVFYQLVSDKKYKSYLKLFASLVLIVLTMNPLMEFFDFQKQLDFNQDVFAYPREVEEFRLKAEQVQGQQYEDILQNYRQTVEGQLERMAERFGMYISSCDIELSGETESFGQVTMVRLMVSYRRTDGNPEGAGRMGTAEKTEEIEAVQEVSIPPIRAESFQTETAVPEAESFQIEAAMPEAESFQTETAVLEAKSFRAGTAESGTGAFRSEADGNQDTANLRGQIIQLYQLEPEQVTVKLEK